MYKLVTVDEQTCAYEDIMGDGDTVRFFVLDGSDAVLVIDSGYLDLDVKAMVLRDLPVMFHKEAKQNQNIILANTHGDMDHTGGNSSFDQFYMTREDYERLHLDQRCPASTCIPAEEGTRIDLGSRLIEYILTPGHTYGNAALLDRTNRILFPGDIIQTNNMFMFGSHRCPEQMSDSLQKLKSLRNSYDIIYACHGNMILPGGAVDEIIAAWNKVLDKSAPVTEETVMGCDVLMYHCGYCNFYCDR